jgi:hypothetical protein
MDTSVYYCYKLQTTTNSVCNYSENAVRNCSENLDRIIHSFIRYREDEGMHLLDSYMNMQHVKSTESKH